MSARGRAKCTSASAAGATIPGGKPSIPRACPRPASWNMSASTSPAPRSTPPSTAARSRPASPSGAIPCRTGSSSRSRARATAPTARTWLKRAKASNFVEQGLVELGDKLGPINWQLAATKQFDPDEIAAFFALLPAKQEGLVLRHAIEPRHESFRDPAFLDLARKAGVAVILADSAKYPAFEDAAEDSPSSTPGSRTRSRTSSRATLRPTHAMGKARAGLVEIRQGRLPVLHQRRQRTSTRCGNGADREVEN